MLKKETIPYFAYGSCMDDARFIKSKVNQHFNKILGRGILDGYTLRFTRRAADGGRADIVEEGGTVEGKVYEMTSDALPYLYRREGVNAGCYRPNVIQIRLDNHTIIDALTFVVVEKEAEIAPPAHYMEEIIRGGDGILSRAYMDSLKKRVKTLV